MCAAASSICVRSKINRKVINEISPNVKQHSANKFWKYIFTLTEVSGNE